MSFAPLLLTLSAFAPATPAAVAGGDDLRSLDRADAVHVYQRTDGRELKLYRFDPPARRDGEGPAAGGLRPALLLFHGGRWQNGSPDSMAPQCRYFAARGLVCFAASYRLVGSAPKGNGTRVTVADCVADARAALRYLADHAAEWSVDAKRIAVGGGSAGGHLALMTALPPGDGPSVAACVLFNPVAALTDRPTFSKEVRADLRDRATLYEAPAERLCPLSNVGPNGPPILLMYGTDDKLLGPANLLRKEYRALGARCELAVWEGRGHGFYHLGKRANRDFIETCARADRFLETLGLTTGPPTAEAFVTERRSKTGGR